MTDYQIKLAKDMEDQGNFYREVDGYMVFDPAKCTGYLDQFAIYTISEYLEMKNKQWKQKVEQGL